MKNITVPAVFVIMFLFFFADGKTYCNDYGISINPQFGFVYGQALELVYPLNTPAELLSELRWDMKPVFYSGFRLDYSRLDLMSGTGFFTSLNFKTGFPGNSGTHENRDWMSTEHTGLTHFSAHTNITREFFILDLTAGISIPVISRFYIIPFINCSWMRFAFSGLDGYGRYPWGYRVFSGEVIRYEQNWLLAALGFSLGTKVFSPFSFELSFQISPLTYCAAKDNHLIRSTVYLDYTGFGLFIEPAARFNFRIDPVELSLDFAYRYIGKTRGNAYKNENDTGFFPAGEAGAALSLYDLSFLIKIQTHRQN